MSLRQSTDKCPHCGEAGALEFGAKLWLDRVRIKQTNDAPEHWGEGPWYEVYDADPAVTADDRDTGLVWSESEYLRCTACDHELSHYAGDITRAFFERYKLRGRRYMERSRR